MTVICMEWKTVARGCQKPMARIWNSTTPYTVVKAKTHYTCFPVASPQHKRQARNKSVTSWRGRKSVVSVVLCRVVSQSPLQQLIANGETCVMDFGRNRFSSIGLPRVQVSWRNSCSVFRSSFGFSKWSRFRHEMVHLRMVTWQKAYNIIFNESFTLVNWHRI